MIKWYIYHSAGASPAGASPAGAEAFPLFSSGFKFFVWLEVTSTPLTNLNVYFSIDPF